jgi:hypothetical protein
MSDFKSNLPESFKIDQRYQPLWTDFDKEQHQKRMSDPEVRKNIQAGKDEWWNSLTDEEKEEFQEKKSKSNQLASLIFDSKEQAEEIFWKCWGEDRGEKLYKKLAKEYKVGSDGIINLVRGCHNGGTHIYCPVDSDQLNQMKQEWEQKYKSYTITVQSPGCDLLDEYDRLYKESEQYNKVADAWKLTTPSVVFHCRFKLKNPTPQSVREYCDSIGIPRIKNDLGQYKQILTDKWKWLTTKKSKKIIFSSYNEVNDFLTLHPENVAGKKINCLQDKMPITWRDGYSFAGWMIRKL